MSSRFFGKWPVDKVGNPLTVTVLESPFTFKDSHKAALSREGKSEVEKPLSPLEGETQNAPTVKVSVV